MKTAIALVAALTALAGAASAQARPLSMTAAERASRAAVAPAVVESVDCERQPGTTGRAALSRAFCTVFHPSDPGDVCRSFVLVSKRHGTPQTRVLGSGVCLPVIETIEV